MILVQRAMAQILELRAQNDLELRAQDDGILRVSAGVRERVCDYKRKNAELDAIIRTFPATG